MPNAPCGLPVCETCELEPRSGESHAEWLERIRLIWATSRTGRRLYFRRQKGQDLACTNTRNVTNGATASMP